ncbi:MAG TPA: PfaD family polyunsaturated fatty acid/polyketide biosynthesis protein [Isosphaeraceae bacterium]|nr:PfaD family polyunsaturated fatty acid/polyketide biosynthesis protein [Isosphaeraceae bacterium]
MELARTDPLTETLEIALGEIDEPLLVVDRGGRLALIRDHPGRAHAADLEQLVAYIPACPLERLGDPGFRALHGTKLACHSGAMANGISSVELVEAMGRAGMLGIFGAAGLSVGSVERAIDRLTSSLAATGIPFGFNLIHSPGEPAHEAAIVDLYLRRGIRLVEASAFLDLTLPVVRYRVTGIRRDPDGRIIVPNRIIAKVSRVEVATKFLSPPPEKMLRELVDRGEISPEQAAWATRIPLAEDLTAEADSGGHTDNQPAIVLLPTMLALRDRMQAAHQYDRPLRVGAAGGISTPWSAASALAMGASYLVTGSVNQACVEAGTSDAVRAMLAQAQQGDIAMAPAADMFEMGVKVQVLKRGTMFAMRATKLYELYRHYESLDQISTTDRALLEKSFFRASLGQVWEQTREYFAARDPAQIERAQRDPKHMMAIVFRSYLGQSSRWANLGEPTRSVDYQIWCGPAMAAFNDWVRGSFLERPAERKVDVVASYILHGAAVLARARMLALAGLTLPPGVPILSPRNRRDIEKRSLTSYHSESSTKD